MPPKRRARPPSDRMPMFPPELMGPDPSQLYPDSQGRYRSLAGANPSPSMDYGQKAMPQPIPPVSITAQSLARRLAASGGEEGSMPVEPKRKRKSLIDYIMEMQ